MAVDRLGHPGHRSIVAAAFFVPIPIFFAYLPGPVRDVEKLIEVSDARTYSSEGSLYLTTVSVDTQVTVFDMISGLVDEEKSIVMQEEVTGDSTLEELQKEQRRQIVESKRYAQQVALSALGLAKPHGDGARITGILEDSPAVGRLQPGDLIVSVDDDLVETPCDVGRSVDAVDLGGEITISGAEGREGTNHQLQDHRESGRPDLILPGYRHGAGQLPLRRWTESRVRYRRDRRAFGRADVLACPLRPG